MTLSSSLLATVAIPALSKLYLSGVVAVDAGGLAASTAKQVLAPLVAGVVVKACAGRAVGAVEPALSIVGIVALVIIVLGTTSLSAELIKASWSSTLAPVALFHIIGFWFGFGVARLLFRMRRPVATAVAFESGFKSPALSFVLARRHFEDVEVQTASAVSILVLVPLAMGAAVAFHLWYVLPRGVGVVGLREGRLCLGAVPFLFPVGVVLLSRPVGRRLTVAAPVSWCCTPAVVVPPLAARRRPQCGPGRARRRGRHDRRRRGWRQDRRGGRPARRAAAGAARGQGGPGRGGDGRQRPARCAAAGAPRERGGRGRGRPGGERALARRADGVGGCGTRVLLGAGCSPEPVRVGEGRPCVGWRIALGG